MHNGFNGYPQFPKHQVPNSTFFPYNYYYSYKSILNKINNKHMFPILSCAQNPCHTLFKTVPFVSFMRGEALSYHV